MKRVMMMLALVSANTAHAQDWTVELFLGGNHQGTLMWGGVDYELQDGFTTGIAVHRQALAPNLEFGLELTHAKNGWVGFPDEEQTGTSLMATGRYLFPLNETFQGYVGAGLGAVRVGYDNAGVTEYDSTSGGQVVLGARYNFASSGMQGFAELRHMDTFEDASLPSGNDVEYRRTDLVIGIRHGF